MPEPIIVAAQEEAMPSWAIRLEGKVDLVVAQQAQRLDDHGEDLKDHENRLRGIERDMPHDAHARLRAVEERKTVSPLQLWTVSASAVTAAAALIALLTKLTGG